MADPITRRNFVAGTLGAGALAGMADLSFINALPLVSAEEAKVNPKIVQLNPDIEPLVRLIEDTPRDKLLEAVARKIDQGTSYNQLLAAVLLAGVRGIQPRPVGFKFHAVLVINSAHLASLEAADRDRWLPLFWSLDNFKDSQERNKREGDWRMPPVDESKVPSAAEARKRFIDAMDSWDEAAADTAVAGLVRSAGAGEVIELFWRYGCRDFRDIGHKAIYVANAWRTLQTIGWRHAEPVMRSLAYALLEHEGTNPARRDAEQDRPGRENLARLKKIRADWRRGQPSDKAVLEVLAHQRTAKPSDACEQVVKLLNARVDPSSIWDGLFLTAGELLGRQPGIVGLHAVTTINALHQAYQLSGDDETRRLVLLQTAAFLPMFRQAMGNRGKLSDLKLDALEKAETGKEDVAEVFRGLGRDRGKEQAARKALAYLEGKGSAETLMALARRLIFLKGSDSHDYKFSSAVLEDYRHVSPAWRNRFLASGLFWLRGEADRDIDLAKRTRAALARS